MVFLLIAFLVIMVVAFFLWKYYRDSQPVHETNKYDMVSNISKDAAVVGKSFMDNFFGLGGLKKKS